MVYNTENEASLQKLPDVNHKFQEKDSGYYCWKLRKKNKRVKKYFSETTPVDLPYPSVQSEERPAGLEQ